MPGSTVGNVTLGPKELRGIVSNGMVLSISEIGGFNNSLVEDVESDNIVVFETATDKDDVAKILYLDGYVIDLSILPDRQYASNYITLAREIAVLKDLEVVLPTYDTKGDEIEFDLELIKYAKGIGASNVTVKDSKTPDFVKAVLYHNEIKPTNTLNDILIFVSFMTGNPIYLVDETDYISLNENELQTDHQTIDILTHELLVKTGELTMIAIASDYKTNPMSIKNIEKIYGLRNARSTTTENLEYAIHYAIHLGIKFGFITENTYPETFFEEDIVAIEIDDDFINNFIGQKTNLVPAKNKMKKLGFEFREEGVIVPPYRRDIEYRADIVEELMRFISLDTITGIKTSDDVIKTEEKHQGALKRIDNTLTSYGLNGTKSYYLQPEETTLKYSLLHDDKIIKLRKDFNLEYNTFRTSLLAGLIESYKYNFRKESRNDI
jgi:phenylalanyl-tRNA synthetase beta chain